MKERADFLGKVIRWDFHRTVREGISRQNHVLVTEGTQELQLMEKYAERKKPNGGSLYPRTILAYLCASVTRSISNMTSSSTVGYSGSFFPISCSIRWYNSTSYLQENKKGLCEDGFGFAVHQCCVHWQLIYIIQLLWKKRAHKSETKRFVFKKILLSRTNFSLWRMCSSVVSSAPFTRHLLKVPATS